MTIVAGYTDGKQIAIAADSGAFEETSSLKMTTATPKIWAVGSTLQGGAGSFRALDVARRANIEDPRMLAQHLMEANLQGGWSVLVVTRKGIYELSEDGSVLRTKECYGAIGEGAPIAVGALAACHRKRVGAPAVIVRLALDVCVRHSSACSTPLSVLSK